MAFVMRTIECTVSDKEAANNPFGMQAVLSLHGFEFVRKEPNSIIPKGVITKTYNPLSGFTHYKQVINE